MKKSKIAQLTPAQLADTLNLVEIGLQCAGVSKAAVVRSLARQDLCSPGSSGIEKTLVAAARKAGVALPPTLAKLMGEAPPRGSESPGLTSAPSLSPSPSPSPSQTQAVGLVCLKSVSALLIPNDGSSVTAVFNDGARRSIGQFDESAFRSSCNLTEFSVS